VKNRCRDYWPLLAAGCILRYPFSRRRWIFIRHIVQF
jgi:hypothetical protein